MYALLSGVITALAIVAAASFLRYYVRTRDRFFAIFGTALLLLGLTQLSLGVSNTPELNRPLAYIPRLVVFLLILFAILDKNRSVPKTTRNTDVVSEFSPRPRRRVAR